MPRAKPAAVHAPQPFWKVRETLNDSVKRVVVAENIHTWAHTLRWLEATSIALYAGRLTREERETFGTLIELRRKYGQLAYEPSEFLDITGSLPLEVLMACAQKCRTRAGLISFLGNPRTPRDDIYIAWKLGLISRAEMEALPPSFSRARFKKPRRRKLRT